MTKVARRGLAQRKLRALVTILAKPEVKERLAGFGLVATGTTAAELVVIMREQTARWKPVIDESGYRMDN